MKSRIKKRAPKPKRMRGNNDNNQKSKTDSTLTPKVSPFQRDSAQLVKSVDRFKGYLNKYPDINKDNFDYMMGTEADKAWDDRDSINSILKRMTPSQHKKMLKEPKKKKQN